MGKSRFLAAIAALCLAVAAATPASSRNVRFPEQGSPAYAIQVPDAWSVQNEGRGSVNLTAPDRSSVISLSLISDRAVELTPADELAKILLEQAKAEPFSRQEPSEIAGLKGSAYYSRVKNPQNQWFNVKLTIVKLDATHAATTSTITIASLTAQQKKVLDTCLKSIKLIQGE